MKNKYGNFVLLKVFSVADESDKCRLAEVLQRYVNSVHVNKYKNRWISFLDENKMYLRGASKNQQRTLSTGTPFYPNERNLQLNSPQMMMNPNQYQERQNSNFNNSQQHQIQQHQQMQQHFQGYNNNSAGNYQNFEEQNPNIYTQNFFQHMGGQAKKPQPINRSSYNEYSTNNNMFGNVYSQSATTYNHNSWNAAPSPVMQGNNFANMQMNNRQQEIRRPSNSYGPDKAKYTFSNFPQGGKRF